MDDKRIQIAPESNEKDLRNEAIIMYVVIGIVLAAVLYADVGGYYESLRTAFPKPIAICIALGLVLGFDLAVSITFLGLRNLFAFGKMARASWLFYLAVTLFAMWGAFHLGGLIMDNVHAVGAKRRAFVNAVDYSNDPLLVQGRQRLATINAAIEAAEKSMIQLSATMKTAGSAAGAFSTRAGDTTLALSARRDQLWNATKANRTQSNVGQSLVETQKGKERLLIAKLQAQDWIDSVSVELDKKYRLKSPEDVIEASIGRNLLRDISSATVIISILALSGLSLVRIVQTGKWTYRNVKFVEAGQSEEPATGGAKGVSQLVPPSAPALTPPEPLKQPFRDMDIEAAGDWIEFRLLTGQYVDKSSPTYDQKTGGDFSQTIHRVGGRHNDANRGKLVRRVKSVRLWLLTATEEAIQKRIAMLVKKRHWNEYHAVTEPVTVSTEAVSSGNGHFGVEPAA